MIEEQQWEWTKETYLVHDKMNWEMDKAAAPKPKIKIKYGDTKKAM